MSAMSAGMLNSPCALTVPVRVLPLSWMLTTSSAENAPVTLPLRLRLVWLPSVGVIRLSPVRGLRVMAAAPGGAVAGETVMLRLSASLKGVSAESVDKMLKLSTPWKFALAV